MTLTAGTSDPLPRLAFISHVFPFPPTSGQNQRIRFMLEELRRNFHVTFMGFVVPGERARIESELECLVDDFVLLDSRWATGNRLIRGIMQVFFQMTTGLKPSNYQIGSVELTAKRVAELVGERSFDVAMLQYWHAWRGVQTLREGGLPVALDMHDVLWRSQAAQSQSASGLGLVTDRFLPRMASYRTREEAAWACFDGVIAINQAEGDYVRQRHPDLAVQVAEMGTDLDEWPYRWSVGRSSGRVAFYGGLGGDRSVRDALFVHDSVMPAIWEEYPQTELVIIGANPPTTITELVSDRVAVTGTVKDPGEYLAGVRAVICPFVGQYGFRSRIVEVMATGAPVVCTLDAVHGMGLDESDGLSFGITADALAESTIELLRNDSHAEQASARGRRTVEERFGLAQTYGRVPNWLNEVITSKVRAAQR